MAYGGMRVGCQQQTSWTMGKRTGGPDMRLRQESGRKSKWWRKGREKPRQIQKSGCTDWM